MPLTERSSIELPMAEGEIKNERGEGLLLEEVPVAIECFVQRREWRQKYLQTRGRAAAETRGRPSSLLVWVQHVDHELLTVPGAVVAVVAWPEVGLSFNGRWRGTTGLSISTAENE